MHVSYEKSYSTSLDRPMEYKVYGHAGRPVVVFPTSRGRFFQYEDSGMIETLRASIDGGQISVWTLDGIDWETFFGEGDDFSARIERHQAYFRYVSDEVFPEISRRSRQANGGEDIRPLLTGCSMGAFHATNFLLRFPWLGDGIIALSGVYSTKHFFGSRLEGSIYFNSPLHYLAGLQDDRLLEQIRRLRLFFCCGRGAWEDEMLQETQELEHILRAKGIPAVVDYWGMDANHDWPWWQRQISHYLPRWLGS